MSCDRVGVERYENSHGRCVVSGAEVHVGTGALDGVERWK